MGYGFPLHAGLHYVTISPSYSDNKMPNTFGKNVYIKKGGIIPFVFVLLVIIKY